MAHPYEGVRDHSEAKSTIEISYPLHETRIPETFEEVPGLAKEHHFQHQHAVHHHHPQQPHHHQQHHHHSLDNHPPTPAGLDTYELSKPVPLFTMAAEKVCFSNLPFFSVSF